MKRQITIIGAGPAGIACAIQLKRLGIEPLIIEKDAIGGLLCSANWIENFPGYPQGIKGTQLVNKLKKHIKNMDIKVIYNDIKDISNLECTHLVVASGTEPKTLPYKNVEYDINKLLKLTNKNIAIIGAGDAAFDYALNLSKKNHVFLLNKNDKIKALPVLVDRVLKSKKIKYIPNVDIDSEIKNNRYDKVLAAIGRVPALSFINEQNIINKKIYYIGDVKNDKFRQASIAIGDGVRVAMEIFSITLSKEV